MKVLFISTFYNDKFGGAEISASNLRRKLLLAGCNVRVYTRKQVDNYCDNIYGIGLKFISKKMFILGNFIIDRIYANAIIKMQIKQKYKPDIIHIQDIFALPAGYIVAKKMNIPVVITVRDVLPRQKRVAGINVFKFRNKTYKKYLQKIDKIIAISLYIRKSVKKFINKDDNIHTIYNLPPAVEHKDVGMTSDINTKKNKIQLLAVGRLDKEKGFDVLIDAMKLVVQKYKSISLSIIGFGPEQINLQRQIKKNRLIEYVTLVGKVDNSIIYKYYIKSDIVIFPSIYQEPLGRIAFEAATYGKPIIASNVGGISETVDDNVTGLLVTPKNIQELSKAIITLSQNEKKRLILGYNAQKNVKEKFHKKKIIKQVVDLYKSLL